MYILGITNLIKMFDLFGGNQNLLKNIKAIASAGPKIFREESTEAVWVTAYLTHLNYYPPLVISTNQTQQIKKHNKTLRIFK